MSTINGFTFNSIGELIDTPTTYDAALLTATYDALIKAREYISASRITQLINALEHVPTLGKGANNEL